MLRRVCGERGTAGKYGLAYRNLCDLPIEDWIRAVDGIMRKEGNIPENDTIVLCLRKDPSGKPMLSKFKQWFKSDVLSFLQRESSPITFLPYIHALAVRRTTYHS